MDRPPSTISTHLTNLTILGLLAVVLLFLGLGSMGLTDRDEGRNAEAGREMLETGNYVSPTFNYEPRFAKPALVYWLMSLSYRWFGVDEFSARLPSAVFGLGLIMVQYLFVSRFFGPVVGLLGALMLLLNVQIIGLSRMVLTDSVLIFFTTLSLFAFWLGWAGRDEERWWRWVFYFSMGIATLAKGPVGFLIPLVTVAIYLTATGQWHRFWRDASPLAGSLLFAAVALPWYAAMWSLHGSQYTASARADTVGRF
ncbi:MAG TPA: phospholipid carrier-dependent glycosyltransferase, partial [Nitrospira sp.]|nr:phospholipid carrier-dependent glycosyltransferase [Nitrospira sp.]